MAVALPQERLNTSFTARPCHRVAHSPAYKIPVIVSFSKTNGVKVWYLYEGKCGECHLESSCRETLENEAQERGVDITAADKLRPPTRLATKIFGLDDRG